MHTLWSYLSLCMQAPPTPALVHGVFSKWYPDSPGACLQLMIREDWQRMATSLVRRHPAFITSEP